MLALDLVSAARDLEEVVRSLPLPQFPHLRNEHSNYLIYRMGLGTGERVGQALDTCRFCLFVFLQMVVK